MEIILRVFMSYELRQFNYEYLSKGIKHSYPSFQGNVDLEKLKTIIHYQINPEHVSVH